MDSKSIKTLILFLIIMIGVLIIFVQQLFMTNTVLNEQEKKQQEKDKQQIAVQEEIKKNTKIGIKDTKIYNSFISKIDNTDVYIDMQVNRMSNIIIALKNNLVYISNNGIDILSKDNNIYVINHEQKIILEKKNAKIEIRDIINIPSTDKYNNVEVYSNIDYIEGKEYNYEKIDNLKYYFENDTLKFVENIEEEDIYTINSITQVTNEEVFNLPLDYDIIDGNSININDIIE